MDQSCSLINHGIVIRGYAVFSFCEGFCFRRSWDIARMRLFWFYWAYAKDLKEKVCKVHNIGLPNA